MRLVNTYKEPNTGDEYLFEYFDIDSFEDLDKDRCKQVYAVCFCDEKMVIGFGGNKKDWGLIGGTVEPGEDLIEALKREIREESNMEVLRYQPIGYQKVTNTQNNNFFYQLRYLVISKPYGEFISDPAGGITEIKLINPKDYKKYFDWGSIGEQIISRAIELKDQFKN